MRTFKEWFQSLNEKFLVSVDVDEYNRTINAKIYINPTFDEIKILGSNIRGFTTKNKNDVYVWKEDHGGHDDIWKALKSTYPTDQDFQNEQPDICFYLEKLFLPDQSYQYELVFSPWSGSYKGQTKQPLRILMTYPSMQKLAPYIVNAKEFLPTQEKYTIGKTSQELQKTDFPISYKPKRYTDYYLGKSLGD